MIQQPASSQRTPWIKLAATTLVGASSVFVFRLLYRYGWDGTLRLLWEGSPYLPELREPHEALDDANDAANSLERTIRTLEVALTEAQLAEESNFSSILQTWQRNASHITDDLRQQLAMLSHNLDLLAARVDAVLFDNAQVKHRKKELSQSIVVLMERADALISFYTKASSPII